MMISSVSLFFFLVRMLSCPSVSLFIFWNLAEVATRTKGLFQSFFSLLLPIITIITRNTLSHIKSTKLTLKYKTFIYIPSSQTKLSPVSASIRLCTFRFSSSMDLILDTEASKLTPVECFRLEHFKSLHRLTDSNVYPSILTPLKILFLSYSSSLEIIFPSDLFWRILKE